MIHSYCDSCVKKIKIVHDYYLEVRHGSSLTITYYDLVSLGYYHPELVPRLEKI